jgi:hypothetical protein
MFLGYIGFKMGGVTGGKQQRHTVARSPLFPYKDFEFDFNLLTLIF